MFKSALRATILSAALLSAIPAFSPAFAADNPVVAKVNGKDVLQSEVMALREEMAAQMPQLMNIPVDAILPELTQRVVDRRVLADAAAEAGMENDPEVVKQMEMIRAELMQRAFLSREVEKEVTDEAVRKLYDEQIKSYEPEDEVHARHILVESEDKAKDLIEKLKDGADFAELAKAESVGPSGPNGGDLGFFSKGQMVPAFAEAAFALDAGEISDEPVQTQYGWHVIKVEERRKSEAPTFEEVEEQLRSQMAQAAMANIVDELRKKARVEILVKPAQDDEAPAGAAQ